MLSDSSHLSQIQSHTSATEMQQYIAATKSIVDSRLEAIVASQRHNNYRELLTAAVKIEGLRERPLLCRISADCCDGNWDDVLPMAVGIELLHLASLIADDVVDNSHVRDGSPTLWKEVGIGKAIL